MRHSPLLSEFEIIRCFFSDIGYKADQIDTSVSLGIGDDCALLSIPNGQRLAVSIDTLLADRHFPANADPFDIAQRALAVSISDLAAMGARPVAFTLALSIPYADPQWLQQFSQGLRISADYYRIPLIGGDTIKGPLCITIQVHGVLPDNLSLQRRGAQLGDMIFVSGSLGDAGAALDILQNKLNVDPEQQQYFNSRFYQPQARVILGEALLDVATAAIDISDGLIADLGHVVKASSVAANIHCEKLPLSDVLKSVVNSEKALCYALTGGDDYELCFTVDPQHTEQLAEYAELFDVPITAIGEIVAGDGVICLDGERNPLEFTVSGYQHF